MRVLVADDSAVARHVLCARLVAAGVTVVEASNVAEATAIDPHSVQAAVLDLDLGDGDGVSLARVLHAKRPDLPVAFFTSEDGTALALEAAKVGPVFPKTRPEDAVEWAKHAINPA